MDSTGNVRGKSGQSRNPDLRDYWRIILRGRWYIITSFVVIVASTAFFTFTADPVYEASAKILVEESKFSTDISSLLSPLGMGSRNDLENRIEMIKSRPVLEGARDKLEANEQFVALYEARQDSRSLFSNVAKAVGMEGEETDSHLITPKELAERLTVRAIPDTDIIEIKATGGSPLEAKLVTNLIVEAYQEKDMTISRETTSSVRAFLAEQLDKVQAELEFSEEQAMEFQKQVGLELGKEGLQQKITQLMALYIQAKVELEDKRDQLEVINKLLDDVKKEIFGKEISGEGADIFLEIEDKLIQLKKFRADIAELEAERAQYIEEGNYVRAKELENEILQKKTSLEETTMAQFTAFDLLPQYEEAIQQQLNLHIEIEAYQNRVQILDDMLNTELEVLVKHGLELMRIERTVDVSKEIYILLRESFEKARISEAGELGGVQIVNWAEEPESPIKPKKKQNLILAALVGLTMGTGLSFLKEYLDNTYKTPKEIEEDLGIPILGSFFALSPREQGRGETEGSTLRQSMLARITRVNRDWAIFDAYAAIEAKLRYADPDRPLTTIAITSAVPEEGKSTVVANLGLVFSETGKKTLIVDADLRKSVVHRIFDIKGDVGLTNLALGEIDVAGAVKRPYLGEGRPVGRELEEILLSGQKVTPAQLQEAKRLQEKEASEKWDKARSLEQILLDKAFIDKKTLEESHAKQRKDLEGFHVLPPGTSPLNPADFLGSERVGGLIEALKSQFDMILFDTSPLRVAPDATLLCRKLDGVILVVEAGKTDKENVRNSVDELQQAGIRIIGIILNKVARPTGRYYGSRYGKYGYGYYGYGYGDRNQDGLGKGRKGKNKGKPAVVSQGVK